ncbi:hypothetical protein [Mycobacterium sp. OTB74]|uniref:hypothetical protein n=1 Tax=Mycobacterium sp. OTB74 TaxID=1853452 RepID=UPI002475A1AB|nr:hypothetical protein [Mycobacterium sp. OTB74]MDH6245743.1 hypothetical protein [Mycobacterium sp. OTB74]
MPNDVIVMLLVRWRAVQWLLATGRRDTSATAAVIAAAEIEGIPLIDLADETDLLAAQFRYRPALAAEGYRLWDRLEVLG